MKYYRKSWEQDSYFGLVSGQINNEVIASCGYKAFKNGSVEIGSVFPGIIMVKDEFKNKGYGKKITQEAVNFALESLKEKNFKIKELYANTHKDNIFAQNILKKIGFVEKKSENENMLKYVLDI